MPRAAAAVLLLASGYLTAGLVNQQEEPVGLTLAATELRTGPNDMTTVRLTDGTVVRLAPESRLRMAGGGGSREVWLEGRAFFAVRRSRDTHFSVRTPAGEVVVLGTRFDVEAHDRSMQVVVVEGRVALSDGVVDVELEANQMTRIQNGTAFQVIDVPEVYRTLSWMGRSLVFQATPLIEVARELEQRFDVEVHVADPQVRDRTVTAWFTDQEFEDVMTVICRAVQARCSISADWARVEADRLR